MSKLQEQIRTRIANKGICAEDIYHKDRLSDAEIASIPAIKVYNWTRQGSWKQKHFNRWLQVVAGATQ